MLESGRHQTPSEERGGEDDRLRIWEVGLSDRDLTSDSPVVEDFHRDAIEEVAQSLT